MDPFSALAVATSVVQFVDFGSKLVSRAIEIHTSPDDLPAELVDMAKLNDKMSAVSKELGNSMQTIPEKSLKPHEQDLLDMCQQCQEISLQLSAALGKVQDSTQPRTWDSLRAAFQSIMEQQKIQSLQSRLDAFRQQLMLHILIALRHHIMENPMEAQVQDPKTGEFVGIGTAFLKRIDERERWQAELVRGVARTYIQSQGVDDLAIRSSRIAEAHKYSEPEIFASQVLSRLRFPSIKDRQHRIPKAYKQTYEWIFTDDNKIGHRWASYTQWLEKKSGLYWITGKPGAGKSTMMKFLARDPRTEDHLRTWSAGSQLLISRFFFWNSGQQIQMSKEGLLRSLLYEVLENCGHLAPVLFPAKWEVFSLFGQTVEETWTWLELDRALKKLLEIGVSQQMKFCFFIDGLDEFDGSPFELVNFFQELVGDASHVKACISSRPWTMFEDAFKACPHFSLEDLTSDDITHFITTKLENNGGFREMQAKDSRFAPQLIADIAKKSSGVFLWVDLVMQSLLEGLTDGDHTAELHRRVDQLPDDLESLFREILEGVRRQNPAYFVSASKFFQLVRAALEPLTLNCLYMADEDSEDPAFFDKVRLGPSTAEERWSRAATMKRRLNSRTKGLLEVDRFSNPLYDETEAQSEYLHELQVQYLHRTVRDYFAKEEVWNWISGATRPFMMPNLALCNAFRLLLKTSDPLHLDNSTLLHHMAACFKYATLLEQDQGKLNVALIEGIDHLAYQVISNTSADQGIFAQRILTTEYHWSSRNLRRRRSMAMVTIEEEAMTKVIPGFCR